MRPPSLGDTLQTTAPQVLVTGALGTDALFGKMGPWGPTLRVTPRRLSLDTCNDKHTACRPCHITTCSSTAYVLAWDRGHPEPWGRQVLGRRVRVRPGRGPGRGRHVAPERNTKSARTLPVKGHARHPNLRMSLLVSGRPSARRAPGIEPALPGVTPRTHGAWRGAGRPVRTRQWGPGHRPPREASWPHGGPPARGASDTTTGRAGCLQTGRGPAPVPLPRGSPPKALRVGNSYCKEVRRSGSQDRPPPDRPALTCR